MKRVSKQATVEWKATKYLHRICAILGALPRFGWSPEARYDTAEYEFWIWPNHILRIDKFTGRTQSTCVRQAWKPGASQPRMPDAEKVASILLLLHDDPKIFEEWRSQAGYINALADAERERVRQGRPRVIEQ